jgi:hypothetical protein
MIVLKGNIHGDVRQKNRGKKQGWNFEIRGQQTTVRVTGAMGHQLRLLQHLLQIGYRGMKLW